MLTWHYLTKAAYDAASVSEKTADKLFFLSDTKQIMRGTQNFSESVELYTGTVPATPAVAKLYINSATLEGKMYNGTAWTTVIQPVLGAVDAANEVNPVSGKAVADYVAEQLGEASDIVSDLDYNSTTKVVTATMLDGTTTDTITLEGLGCNLTFEAISGNDDQKALKLKDVSGNVLATVNLDLERFVTHAEYDSARHMIILCFDEGEWVDPGDHTKGKTYSDKIEIDVGDLVDTYTVTDSSSVDLSMTNNEISATVKLSANANNAITSQSDGLHVDISGKVDKLASATAGDIATVTADGQFADSGKKIGGATITYDAQDQASANTLATEAAVEAIRAALKTAIDGKIAKMEVGDANKVVLSTADGQVQRSTKEVGSGTFAATPNANTLATEAGVAAYVANGYIAKDDVVDSTEFHDSSASASDTAPVTEKAVLAALEWKTTV